MTKKWIIPLAIALIAVNMLPVLWRDSGVVLHLWTAFTSAVIGIVLIAISLRAVQPIEGESAVQAPGKIEEPQEPKASPPPVRAEAEVVALLALLQQEGRLVDFVMEDISRATDAELGSVARVVHSGCRKVIKAHFAVEPIESSPEGSRITLSAGYVAQNYRLLGTVAAQPPYTGNLLHPGWKAVSVKLPELVGQSPTVVWPVLAPAEVEIKN